MQDQISGARRSRRVLLVVAAVLGVLLIPCTGASAKTAQQITLSPSRSAVANAIFEVQAESSSREQVSLFSLTSSVCTVSPGPGPPSRGVSIGVVHGLAAGTCTILARQEGSSTYEAAEAQQSYTIVTLTSDTNFGLIESQVERTTGVVNATVELGSAGTLKWQLTYTGKSGATEVLGEGSKAISDECKLTCTVTDKFTVTPSAAALSELKRRKEAGLPVRVLLTFECSLAGCPVSKEWAITDIAAPELPAIDRELTLEKLGEIALKEAGSGKVTEISAVRTTIGGARSILDPSCTQCGIAKENEEPAFFLVLRGQGFTPAVFSPPAGYTGGEPTGDVKTLVIVADTGFVTEEGIRETAPDLTALGHVSKLAISDSLKITFTSAAPESAMVGGADYDLSATSAGRFVVSFSSATLSVCAISGTSVSFLQAGVCTIEATVVDAATGETNQSRQFFTVGPQIVKLLGKPSINPRSGVVKLKSSVAVPGTLTWQLGFKSKSGATEVFGKGSMTITGASMPTITIKPSDVALKALKQARKQRHRLSVKMLLTFSQSTSESPPVAVERTITVKGQA